MSRILIALYFHTHTVACSLFAQKPAAAPAPEKVIAIHAATLIDGVSAQPRHNVLIIVRGNRIESVTDGGTPPAGATVINLPAQLTVLPGLIDTHTHIFLQGEDPAEGGYDIQLLKHPIFLSRSPCGGGCTSRTGAGLYHPAGR